jgi:hypothetical protein
VLLAIVAGCAVAPQPPPPAAGPAPDTWPGCISIFTKGGGWPEDTKAAENYLAAVREAGFGAYHGDPKHLPALRRHSLMLFAWGDDSGERHRLLRDEPDVLGYWMRYPTPVRLWSGLAPLERRIREADPNHPALYALEMTWGMPSEFLRVVRPRVLWYRHYLWEGHHPQDKFHGARWAPMNEFMYLEDARRAALTHGVPIVRWVHVAKPKQMRYVVSMSLCHGIRGFTWWQGWTFFDLKKTDRRGVPVRNELGEEVARLNATMRAFAPIFKKTRCVAVYHGSPFPMFPIVANEESLAGPVSEYTVMGVFEGEGGPYFVLGNRRLDKPQEALIQFNRAVAKVEWLDRKTETWSTVELKTANGKQQATVQLGPAGVEMVRVSVQESGE